ncbi:MAG: hypothetical protein HYS89_01700 [Candidatus Colwellbacteria bacterium]|nr:hypothetical protein [Candidatus Colwellbacteria bacterium]
MPFIKVWGTRHYGQNFVDLDGVEIEIKKAVVGIEELGLDERQVTVAFPLDVRDLDKARPLGDMIVEIDDLFAYPARTREVRLRVAAAVGTAVREAFPNAKLVKVFVLPFDPNESFWSG